MFVCVIHFLASSVFRFGNICCQDCSSIITIHIFDLNKKMKFVLLNSPEDFQLFVFQLNKT